MATTRINQLQKLAGSLPGANQKVAQGLQAARETQLQETIRQAQPGTGPQAAQQLGAQQAQQAGQIQLQTQQQTQQDLSRVAQTGLQQQQLEAQQRLGGQRRQLSAKQRDLAARLNKLDQNAKNQLLDQQLEFRQDERGRVFMNERQLADWAALNAKSDQEFQMWKQDAMQMHDRKIQMMQTANKKLAQVLEQGYTMEGKRLNQQQQLELAKQQAALQEKLRKEAAKRKEKAAMWGAVGTIFGAVVGGVVGGPGGASGGGQAGGAFGEAGGTAF